MTKTNVFKWGLVILLMGILLTGYGGCGKKKSSGSSGGGGGGGDDGGSSGLTPHLVGSYDTPDCAAKVFVAGNYAYVADWTSGLQIIDISTPAVPTLAGSYNTPGKAVDVVVSGNYAYVADDTSGMAIIDISNPSAPISVGSYSLLNVCQSCIAGNYAYFTWGQLRVLDISDPANPTLVNSVSGFLPCDICVSGVYAYGVGTYVQSYIAVINISEPITPTVVEYCRTAEIGNAIYFYGGRVYVAEPGIPVLEIFSVGNPSNPTLLGQYQDNENYAAASDVYVSGNYAYVANNELGLKIINVSDPANPTLAGSYNTGSAMGVYVSGNYAYVANGTAGLQIIGGIK